MHIAFIDLKAQYDSIKAELDARLARVLQSANFILGGEVAEFEQAFAAYCECPYGVGVASGLDAIKLALRALEIGPGDEVITAANTFIATALGISAVGATPVLVDIDPRTYNLDPARLAAALTPRTKAIMPVHLYGQPADMEPILQLARARRLLVIEDASQAHGARYRGRRVGSLGDIAVFSLYPGKNLGAYGDAGVITTHNPSWAEKITTLRNYGSKIKYYHDCLGENSRLDTLQAAVVMAKLPHLDGWNAARRKLAAHFTQQLTDVGDVVTPYVAPETEPVFHQYVIRTARRDALLEHLKAQGIPSIIHYPVPIHLQKAYAGAGWKAGDFPITEKVAGEILSLPQYPEMPAEHVTYVLETIRRFYQS